MPSATPWTAANDKWTANMSAGVSVAAGLMGTDGANSFLIPGGLVAWTYGDPYWATAAGQNRSQCTVPRNGLTIQSGSLDLSAATLTHYVGAGATSFFPERAPHGCPCWHWPSAGVLLDDRLLINSLRVEPSLTGLGFRVRGATVWLVDNPAATPDLWNMTPIDLPGAEGQIQLALDLIDGGDGWLYAVGSTDVPERALYMARFNRADARRGKINDPQWWMGAAHGFGRGAPRRLGNNFPLEQIAPSNGTGTTGTVQRLASGWLNLQAAGFPRGAPAYALAANKLGPFPKLAPLYTPPEATTYNVLGHAEQTFAGQGPHDLVVSYAAGLVSNDNTSYWPKFLQATDLSLPPAPILGSDPIAWSKGPLTLEDIVGSMTFA